MHKIYLAREIYYLSNFFIARRSLPPLFFVIPSSSVSAPLIPLKLSIDIEGAEAFELAPEKRKESTERERLWPFDELAQVEAREWERV